MFPSEYEVQAHRRELMQQAEQHRLAHAIEPVASWSQRAGENLLRWGAFLTALQTSECVTVKTHGQVVTVCSA